MHTPLLRRRHFNWTLLALVGWGLAASALASPSTTTQRVLVLGDSLSAEYGLVRGTGWVALLQKQLAQEKPGVEVINASISGDTTSGGRSRLPALLKNHQPSHVIIELGGNDALRGLPMAMTQGNLLDMAQKAKSAGAQVMLLGMQMPPNYGPEMARQFEAAYVQVAKSQKAALVPFFLKGVGDDSEPLKWFQSDRIHPNEAAQPRLLANVWPTLKKQLK
ncbi:arylesterase [Limnohabitans sp. 15K]|uniref:arylesterase n=1 Tax=Limnohabitans sp. 15K TaxID=1100706 RepID=UPI000C1E559B|nr:arylesterase [Limnohabitans sp. 15K]PIT83724.1 arylesterase [Limnohabitans sp. 15K]